MVVLIDFVMEGGKKWSVQYYPPLGLACLAKALRQAGHAVQILLFWPGRKTQQDCVDEVLALKPSLVGFSVFLGTKLQNCLELSRALKQARSDLPIIWGGPLPSAIPKKTLMEPSVDWVCMGPGEDTIVTLSEAVLRKRDIDSVLSLAHMVDGRMVINPPGIPRPVPATSAPDWESFSKEEFILEIDSERKVIGFITSRGCSSECGFCYNLGFHGRRWRSQPLDEVQTEMLRLRDQHGVNGFFFFDDCFFVNRRRALQLLRWMADNGFWCRGVDARIDQLDREVLEALRSVDTTLLFIGAESASDRILNLIKKGITFADTEKALELLADYPEMLIWLSFVVGFPTETFEEMQTTIVKFGDIVFRRDNTKADLNFYFPLPGTPLYELGLQEGFQEPEQLEDWVTINTRDAKIFTGHFPNRINPAQCRWLQDTDVYLSMAGRLPSTHKRGFAKRLTRQVFRYCGVKRLQHKNLALPADAWLFRVLSRVFGHPGSTDL